MVAFISFAVFIGVLVTVCVKQNISLVSKDYYKDELNYQQEINELNNSALLKDRPVILVHGKKVEVIGVQSGELTLIRPSDSRYDAKFDIDSLKTFDLSNYPSGKYNASLRWKSDGKSFLLKESVNL